MRLGFRLAMEIAVVGAAAAVRLEGGAIADCRIALTAVAPTIIRASGAEAALSGVAASPARIEAAGEAARAHARPIDDVRAPAWYRLDTTAAVTRRAIELALERASRGGS